MDSAYDGLVDDGSQDPRWAFGTGFTAALDGVDTTIPSTVDADGLAARCLALGDDALIYSHRLQQWVTRAPELEEETALANIALDLLGQARLLLARAGMADGTGRDEDALAFFRDEPEFRNVRMVERRDADFAELVGRLLVFSAWRLAEFEQLRAHPDPVLAAVAARGVPELAYHRDYAARWVVRLGDGTELSRRRMQAGLDTVWPYVGELRVPSEVDAVLDTVLAAAGLDRPSASPLAGVSGRYGRDGVHTEDLGYVLAELQSVARAHPDATW